MSDAPTKREASIEPADRTRHRPPASQVLTVGSSWHYLWSSYTHVHPLTECSSP
jgi:hypothetical protein